MSVTKSWPHQADLDELEEELRSVATAASRDRHDADVLAELARKVGRDTATPPAPLPSATQRGAVVKFRPRSQGAAPLEFDLESEIKKAVRTDYTQTQPQAGAGDAPQPHELRASAVADVGGHDATASPHGEEAWHDHDSTDDFAQDAPHDLDHHYGHDDHDMAGQPGNVPEEAHGTSRMRRVVLPLALALTMSTAVVGLGIGAVALLRSNQPDPVPAPAQPAETAAAQQSASADAKPAEASTALPAVASASPRDASSEAASSPASSQMMAPDLGTAPSSAPATPDAGPQAASRQPVAAPQEGSAADAAPAPGPNAVTTSGTQTPSQTPSQPLGQGASLGTPRRVATVSVRPDGSIAPVDSPLPPARPTSLGTTAASTDTALPADDATSAKKPADAAHAKPAVAANAARSNKTTPPETSPPVVASNQQPPEAQPAEPPSVTSVLRKVIEGGSAPQPAAPPVPAAKPVAGGVSLKLASSTTEHDAQMTLAKLQKQFPGALQGAAVHREDMGKDGVFYRVRVGPLARDAANKLCAELKAGGASCAMFGG